MIRRLFTLLCAAALAAVLTTLIGALIGYIFAPEAVAGIPKPTPTPEDFHSIFFLRAALVFGPAGATGGFAAGAFVWRKDALAHRQLMGDLARKALAEKMV